jgi:class 3 adenylate cyclase/YHS domain-containing protein
MADEHTFLLADLAGFTALTEAHGDARAAKVASDFFGAVRALLPDYRGVEVKSIGDALLVRLASADQAVHLAARLVNDYGARHESLGVRVGVHTGTAVEQGGDWFGSAVNVAARVADAARAGEVLVTADARAAAAGALATTKLVPRGAREFKNVGRPIELYAVVPDEAADRQLPIDPVCRMAVDPARSDERRVHRGVEYHFCSTGCAQAFDEQPSRYGRRRAGGGALPRRRESTWRLLVARWRRGRRDPR